jgi:MFS family permease
MQRCSAVIIAPQENYAHSWKRNQSVPPGMSSAQHSSCLPNTMPIISRHMALTPVQKSIAIAIPVLLGSLGRIPLGILTDRFGGRIVFSVVMVLSIVPAFLMDGVSRYGQLLATGS